MVDVVIIGGGIVGSAAAYELSRYDLSVTVLERENDVAMGATRANSGIIHAGYSSTPGSLMARLNVAGSRLAKDICEKLDVLHRQCGSLVVALSKDEIPALEQLLQNSIENSVPGVVILDREKTLEMEPNLSADVVASLYAPSAMIVSPWEYALAMMETAVINGVRLCLECEVGKIDKTANGYRIHFTNGGQSAVGCEQGFVETRYVINAAGLYSDKVHNMAAEQAFQIAPARGQYFLLDKSEGNHVNHVIFQCPSEVGKGVLIAPTVHGNLLVGPDSEKIPDRDNVSSTVEGLDYVMKSARRAAPNIDFSANIRSFAGNRARTGMHDFIIAEAVPGFIDLAGICSPGLSAAPAIAAMAADILRAGGLELHEKRDFIDKRERIKFHDLSQDEKAELVARDPAYGRVVCRCETVTEGEVRDSLLRPIPPRSIDAVKRRVGAGSGRCQGGFCGPRILDLLAEHYRCSPTEVLQNGAGSYVLTSETSSRQQKQEDYKCDSSQSAPNALPGIPSQAADQMQDQYELAVIGGGPAGLAAAYGAWKSGIRKIIIIERDKELGGILNQCIHNGFGLHYFKEELTGPQYAERYIKMLHDTSIEISLDAMALEITPERDVHYVSKAAGYRTISAQSVVLAMGCRERTRGAIGIAGARPAGVLTAGAAQRYVNIEGYMPGKRIVILGSGDVGLIMARRMRLQGAEVLACIEIMPQCSGLTRNVVQCLHDFDIPLYLSHTITEIRGKRRVEQVEVAKVDENRRPIPGTEMVLNCDTVLLSVGLIPENELSRAAGIAIDNATGGPQVSEDLQTSMPGVFACGNALHVLDLVDHVTVEGERAGASAASFVMLTQDR